MMVVNATGLVCDDDKNSIGDEPAAMSLKGEMPSLHKIPIIPE
jgi:hypothetical protein